MRGVAVLVAVGGCGGGGFACVSEDWVLDAGGLPLEACVTAQSRAACEDLVGHPAYGPGCGRTFDLAYAECPGLSVTEDGAAQLGQLGVSPDALRVASCGTGTEGDTGAPTSGSGAR